VSAAEPVAAAVRPSRLVVVAGTGTGVGKTWVGVALVTALRAAGVAVAVRKPVQSAEPGEPLDGDLLAAASGEPAARVTPPHRTLRVPYAPPMAADVLGSPAWTVAELAAEVRASWAAGTEVGLVELAGGPASPVADDGDGAALTRLLEPDLVVVVADPSLGAINAVRLSCGVLAGPWELAVLLNRFDAGDDLHVRTRAWLRDRDGFDVAVGDGVDALAGHVLAARCDGCGRTRAQCAGCRTDLEPPRFCARCGVRLAVRVQPMGWTARCREHGELSSASGSSVPGLAVSAAGSSGSGSSGTG
jgi:dethiobiotin synthetase